LLISAPLHKIVEFHVIISLAKQTECLFPSTYFKQIVVLVLTLVFLLKETWNYTVLSILSGNITSYCLCTCQVKWIVLVHTVQHSVL